jgi:hypothetical protein
VILISLARSLGCNIPDAVPTFADNADISGWAMSQVGQAQAAGIISGTGNNNFSPKGLYTREQSILTLLKLSTSAQATVTKVQMENRKETVLPGGSKTLKATAYENSTPVNQVFTWSSSDPEVASIDPYSGKVNGIAPGKTTITATAANGKSGTCTVIVPDISETNAYADIPTTFYADVRTYLGETYEDAAELELLSIESKGFSSVYMFQIEVEILDIVDGASYLIFDWETYDAGGNFLMRSTFDDRVFDSMKAGKKLTLFISDTGPRNSGPFWVKIP